MCKVCMLHFRTIILLWKWFDLSLSAFLILHFCNLKNKMLAFSYYHLIKLDNFLCTYELCTVSGY